MKIVYTLFGLILVSVTNINVLLAAWEVWRWAPTWLLEWLKSENWKSASERIRTGDIHVWDIPGIIKAMIDIFLWIAWTVAVIFVIIWAYKILFGSLQQDITKWRDTIIMALTWFAFATLAWFIVKFVFTNFWA